MDWTKRSMGTMDRIGALAAAVAAASASVACLGGDTLVGRAVLPAQTFADGPTSGTLIGGPTVNGVPTPFTGKQPVQGFSAILAEGDGTYLVMCDNGFGSLENSADFNLRVYHVAPAWETAAGGEGGVAVLGFFELRDPDRRVPFAIVSDFSAALALARDTDLIATVPERHTANLRHGMTSFSLPMPTTEFTVSMLWHPRMDADPVHRWLRSCVREVCAPG